MLTIRLVAERKAGRSSTMRTMGGRKSAKGRSCGGIHGSGPGFRGQGTLSTTRGEWITERWNCSSARAGAGQQEYTRRFPARWTTASPSARPESDEGGIDL